MAASDLFPFAVWLAGTNQNSIPANDNALRVEVLTGPALSILSAQPGTPTEGDQYILGSTPSGAQWASFAQDDVVIFKGGTWLAFSPYAGWLKYIASDGNIYQFAGSGGWDVFAGGGGGSVSSVNGQTGAVVLELDDLADIDASAPADGDVLTFDSGTGDWVPLAPSGGGGGLTNITEALVTASPNGTNNVVSLAVTGGSTNAFFALIPKGTGGVLAAVPDGTSAGGDVRGAKSVDWQISRSSSAQVAGADYSVIGGGFANRIDSGLFYSVVAGGSGNKIDSLGGYSVIGGGLNNSISSGSGTGKCFIGGGQSNSHAGSADYGCIIGGFANQNTAIDSGTILGGRQNTVTSSYSAVIGLEALTRTTVGMFAQASGSILNQGDAQAERYVLKAATTNATVTPMSTDFSGATNTGQPVLKIGSAMNFFVKLIARDTSTDDAAGWNITGIIKRSGSTVSFVGTPTVTSVATDASLLTCVVAIAVDGTSKALQINVTGIGATTIRWVAVVELAFVG